MPLAMTREINKIDQNLFNEIWNAVQTYAKLARENGTDSLDEYHHAIRALVAVACWMHVKGCFDLDKRDKFVRLVIDIYDQIESHFAPEGDSQASHLSM